MLIYKGLAAAGKQTKTNLISSGDLLQNFNNALQGIIRLDFEIINTQEGLIRTDVVDTLCEHLGTGHKI